jgi:hypothetical protein
MQPRAWKDAQKVTFLPPYWYGWSDADWNASAAAAYLKLNQERLLKIGLDVGKEPGWLYLAHQQGVEGLNNILTAIKQRKVLAGNARRRLLVNPAPGTRPTDNPKLWYSRWMRHLREELRFVGKL